MISDHIVLRKILKQEIFNFCFLPKHVLLFQLSSNLKLYKDLKYTLVLRSHFISEGCEI